MGFNRDNLKRKLIIIGIYFVFCIALLPLIYIFYPRTFLFSENSQNDEDKKYLFQTFASEIHDNINKSLISDIQLIQKDEKCPDGYELLNIEHQYYGKFTLFFNYNSFCIKRSNKEEFKFNYLLDNAEFCESQKKGCGIVNKRTNKLLCVNENENCPFNDLDISQAPKNNDSHYIIDSKNSFIPKFGKNSDKPLIINIDIINKDGKNGPCFEKFHRYESIPCEFPDDDNCHIDDYIRPDIYTSGTLSSEYILTAKNLAKINLKEDDELLQHDYCYRADTKLFYIYAKGFVNFNKEELDNFIEEFPLENKYNNQLTQVCDLYKSKNNIEILFKFFAVILPSWSFFHLVLKFLIFFLKNYDFLNVIKKIYLWNSIIIFFVKLICLCTLITSHYNFYLKFKNVYLTIEEDPRNDILNEYKTLRKSCIGKIIGIDISGIIMIIIELIILRVIYFINSEFAFEDNEDNEYIFESGNVQINSRNLEIKQGGDSKDELIEKFENNDIEIQPEVKEKISLSDKNNKINNININVSKDNQEQKENTLNKPGNTFGGILQVSDENENKNKDIPNPYNKNKVNLIFEFNENDENLNSPYEIMVYINETFNNIEKQLKKKYPELENKNMNTFIKDGSVIKKDETVEQNDIKNNDVIIVS